MKGWSVSHVVKQVITHLPPGSTIDSQTELFGS
jgi:hypothetical protein